MKLNQKQTQAIDFLEDKTTNEIILGGGAGGGKSILGCYWQLKSRLKYPGTKGLIGRANLKTLKETTLQSFFKVCKLQNIKIGTHFEYNGSNHKTNPNSIEFKNGSIILLKDLKSYPSDPNFDDLGSLEITDAFVDEANQISERAWNIVRIRIRHDVKSNDLIPKMLGTCNPSKGFVYDNFYKPSRDGILSNDKKFIQALVTDNPDIDKFYFENLLKLDERSKQRLLYGNWEYDDDPYILMSYENIVGIFANNNEIKKGEKYITCDAARLGKDKTIIRVWDGLTCFKKFTINKCRVDELVNFIKKVQKDYGILAKNTIVDEGGVGGGVVDYLRCVGFLGGKTPITILGEKKNYTNLRSQCYFKLAEIVENSEMQLKDENIDDREKIVQELEQIRQVNSLDGKLKVTTKEDLQNILRRSPDEADSIMMRCYFELFPNVIQKWNKSRT